MRIPLYRAFKLSELACIVDGIELNITPSTTFSFVTTDSREVLPGDLFIALRGEKNNGHDYLPSVLSKGAFALCEKVPVLDAELSDSESHPSGDEKTPLNHNHLSYEEAKKARQKERTNTPSIKTTAPCVLVENTTIALGLFASAYASEIPHKTIAVTGSVGKTTTKECIAHLLSMRYRVHKTHANYNNEFGMPYTLLSMPYDTEILVLELGMCAKGEIAYLSRLAKPDIAVVTCIGSSHLETLGTRENIASAKMEIVEGMQDGTLYLPCDEPLLSTFEASRQAIKFSIQDIAITSESMAGTHFSLVVGGETIEDLYLPCVGKPMLQGALIATHIALSLGLGKEEIRKGLKNSKGEKMRQSVHTFGGIMVLADCYNAAPESMQEALKTLLLYAKERGGKSFALLGDMCELGEMSARMHADVGRCFAKDGVDFLYAFGKKGIHYALGAKSAGMPSEQFMHQEDPLSFVEHLQKVMKNNDVLLIKASRAMTAENILFALEKAYQNDEQDRLD